MIPRIIIFPSAGRNGNSPSNRPRGVIVSVLVSAPSFLRLSMLDCTARVDGGSGVLAKKSRIDSL